jgi:hypothetical protein
MKAQFAAFAVALLPLVASPQGVATIIFQRPVHAQHLAGYVRVRDISGDSQGISSVRVEECDAGCKNVLSSTATDAQGHFHLAPLAKGATHYLRLSAPGFNPSLYTVKLSSHAPSELDLRITVAT